MVMRSAAAIMGPGFTPIGAGAHGRPVVHAIDGLHRKALEQAVFRIISRAPA
jgi:hypothetical protein